MASAIDWATELPVTSIPNEPLWSENYYFVTSDASSGVWLAIHMGRWSKDNSLWREQVMIGFPDGSFALSRNIVPAGTERGPGGGLLALRCEEPGQRWTLGYHGPTRSTSAGEVASGAMLTDTIPELLDVDLVFEGSSAVWNFGDMGSESWASFHYEQAGRITGRIRFGGKDYSLDGPAHRDHSRGPRRYSGLEGAVWMQGHFPNGRSFALMDVKMVGADRTQKAVILEDGKLFPAMYSGLPVVTGFDEANPEFLLRLSSELGDMTVMIRCLAGLAETADDRNEILYGRHVQPGSTELIAQVGPTELVWEGQKGRGHVDLCWGPARP